MEYQVLAPHPELRPFVQCLWTLRGRGSEEVDRIVPDGHMELVFHGGDPFRESTSRGAIAKPRALVVGELRRTVEVVPGARVDVLGVRFTPIGARAVLRVPATLLADQSVDFDAVAEGDLRGLAVRVLSASSATRAGLVQSALVARLRERRLVDPMVARIVGHIERHPSRTDIARLATTAGLTTRQLERRFKVSVGISPRAFASVLRFRRVFEAIEQHHAGWADVACASGYYDQSQLVRDFRRFTGMTPGAFFGVRHPLSELWMPRDDVAFVQSNAAASS